MNREDVLRYLGGCFYGEPASCTFACPFRLDLRNFLKKMSRGRFDAAYKELCTVIPFPEITAQMCDGRCEKACQCGTVVGGDPVRVNALEKSCVALAKEKTPPCYAIEAKSQRIAVVGAGVSGLSCALTLARRKYPVTVFEKTAAWGGALTQHPLFESFAREFALQFSQEQVDFVFGREICALDELRDFDAVYLAVGAGGNAFGLLESWNSALLYTAMPGVFLGGAVTGVGVIDAMAAGARCVRSIEAYLQTKNPENAKDEWDEKNACRYVPHPDVQMSRAVDTDAQGRYEAAEAKQEAGRCMQCECKQCMNVCELMEKYKKAPTRIASDVLMDGEARNSVSTAAITRQTWSCNLCGRCADRCPENTDIGGMLQLSRVRRVEGKLYPPAIHAYWLEEMEFANTRGKLLIPAEGQYAFFPGCRLGASNPDYVRKPYEQLKETLGAGLLLCCCGVPAYWAGEQARFEAHLATIRADWQTLGKPTMILACPSCEKVFGTYLPEIPTVSLYELLPADKAKGREEFRRAAVFDPCAARDLPKEKAAVRALAEGGGTELSDFDSDGKCCGFGGHMQLANPTLYTQILENRVGACEEPYIVYCTNCRETFLQAGKQCAHILDLYYGLEPKRSSLEDKRVNAIALKKQLMEQYNMGQCETQDAPWDAIEVEVPCALSDKMDRALIPLREVKRVLWTAQNDGTGFETSDGVITAFLTGEYVTVWVEARKKENGGYVLQDVYSHRMRLITGGA